jgi:hypothetical protein
VVKLLEALFELRKRRSTSDAFRAAEEGDESPVLPPASASLCASSLRHLKFTARIVPVPKEEAEEEEALPLRLLPALTETSTNGNTKW